MLTLQVCLGVVLLLCECAAGALLWHGCVGVLALCVCTSAYFSCVCETVGSLLLHTRGVVVLLLFARVAVMLVCVVAVLLLHVDAGGGLLSRSIMLVSHVGAVVDLLMSVRCLCTCCVCCRCCCC